MKKSPHVLIVSVPDGDAENYAPVIQHIALQLAEGKRAGSIPGDIEWAWMEDERDE